MRIAVTGASGFVGGALVRRLTAAGHEVMPVSRRHGVDLTDGRAVLAAFEGCEAVAHCAGINREIGPQTYERVHVEGTRVVVRAATDAGVRRLALVSFLRARPDGPTAYHRSKWTAESIVRGSGLDWTVLKPGVIHGPGDHMLDHLSRAFHSFPLFATVGVRGRDSRLVRPVALDDVARVLEAAVIGDPRLARATLAVLGPEQLTLDAAVRRVAAVTGRSSIFVPTPTRVLVGFAWLTEQLMQVPLLAVAQAHILAEGITEPAPFADPLPTDLAPTTPFSPEAIRAGLPEAGGFGLADLRCCLAERVA
jgi:NADH dehydrogenase